jgi:excisionase family DNA binding protein
VHQIWRRAQDGQQQGRRLVHRLQLRAGPQAHQPDGFDSRRKPKTLVLHSPAAKGSEILDVHMTAELLTVSPDTEYDLFKKGELPARKVGRKWLTTRSTILSWIEPSPHEDTLKRKIEQGDRQALLNALKTGKAQVKTRV